jgi:uncharacterized repeat protein (TIGR01451 family)
VPPAISARKEHDKRGPKTMRPTYISGPLRWYQVLAAAGFITTLLVAASPFAPQAAAAGLTPHVGASAKPTAATSAPTRTTAPAGAGQKSPALSIDVSDGTTTAKPGDVLSYTVNIRNIGSASAPPLDIALMLPPAFRLLSASGNGAQAAGQVKWRVNLQAGRSGTFRVVGRVGRTPGQLLRLDAIACATTAKGAKPIVCAASSDELPAGVAAAARARAVAPSADHLIRYVLVAAAALVLVLVLGGIALIARRRLVPTKHARSSR